jgi:hypothetical protein
LSKAASARDIVVYFVSLPDALPIPTGATFRFQYDDRNQPYLALAGAPSVSPVDLLRGAGDLDVAVRFWIVPSVTITELAATSAAINVAEYVTGTTKTLAPVAFKSLLEEFRSDRPSTVVSVAEAATFKTIEDRDSDDTAPVDIEIDDLTDPLLRCLHCLQHLVRSYRVSANSIIPELSYPRFQPDILSTTWDPSRGWPPPSFEVVSLSHKNLRGAPPKALRNLDLVRWQEVVQLLSAGDPSTLSAERMVNAARAFTIEGDWSSAVLQASLAIEVFLDGVLGLLLWERFGGAPRSDGAIEQAVAALSKDLRPRLRSEYHPLLGGSWDPAKEGPIREWDLRVARLRGRVVHRGYRPRATEAADAMNAVEDLFRYVCDLISRKAREFPRTALMMVGNQGLKDRNAWQRIRTFATDRAQEEQPWRDSYWAWRDRVDQGVVRRGQAQ